MDFVWSYIGQAETHLQKELPETLGNPLSMPLVMLAQLYTLPDNFKKKIMVCVLCIRGKIEVRHPSCIALACTLLYDTVQVIKEKLTGPDFVWFLPGWFKANW